MTSVWAIAMVKDEADVIEDVLRHVAAQGVDGILVLDNMSTDGTREIIERVGDSLDCKLGVREDDEVGYYQSRKMTGLAEHAHVHLGADWVWPFDADELWYYGEHDRLADVIARADGDVIHSRLWHHFPTAIDAGDDGNPFTRMCYRGADEAPIGKVIARWQPGMVIAAGNHALEGSYVPSSVVGIEVRHFPYRSEEQFIRKAINGARAYAATDLPWGTGQHWREYGLLYAHGGVQALRDAYNAHFVYDLPSAAGLVYDPARLDA